MNSNTSSRINVIDCERSYYIPNTNIRVEETDPIELEKLWSNIENLNGLI